MNMEDMKSLKTALRMTLSSGFDPTCTTVRLLTVRFLAPSATPTVSVHYLSQTLALALALCLLHARTKHSLSRGERVIKRQKGLRVCVRLHPRLFHPSPLAFQTSHS